MRKPKKINKPASGKKEIDPANLPEYVHIVLEEDDECAEECDACTDRDEDAVCKCLKQYVPEIIKRFDLQGAGTLIGHYKLVSKHVVDVVLVDVDKKGNKIRR